MTPPGEPDDSPAPPNFPEEDSWSGQETLRPTIDPDESDRTFVTPDEEASAPPVAPPDAIEALIDRIPPISRKSAKEFASWLDIPSDGLFLDIVLDALRSRAHHVAELAKLDDFEVPDFFETGLLEFRSALQGTHFRPPFGKCWSRSATADDPTKGTQSLHTFYAAHPYPPKNIRPSIRQYDLLQAHLSLAALKAWDNDLVRYPHGVNDALKKAARAVRRLCFSSMLPHLPDEPLRQEGYRNRLQVLLDPQASAFDKPHFAESDIEFLRLVVRLLAIVTEQESHQDEVDIPISYIGSDDVDGIVGLLVSQQPLHPSIGWQSPKKSGLAPAEYAMDVEYVTPTPPEGGPRPDRPPQRPPTLAELLRSRLHQIAAMERGNQLLPIAWQRLRTDETARFLQCLSNEISICLADGRRIWTDNPLHLEATALLTTSFWTARSIDDCQELILFASRDKIPTNRKLRGIAFILDTKEWCLPALRPKKPPAFAGTDFTLAEPVAPLLFLPTMAAIAQHICKLPSAAKAAAEGTATAFKLDPVALRAQTNSILQSIGRRVTYKRIADHLFFHILDKTRDLGMASLILGHRHRLADTALHYACYDLAFIRAQYSDVCREILQAAYLERAAADGPRVKDPLRLTETTAATFIESPLAGLRIGVPICPTQNTVQRLRLSVETALIDVNSHPVNPDFQIRFHNLFVLYTSLMLKDATGYRDIGSPLPRRSDIDLADRTILVSDKDDAASFNARVLPIVEPLYQQLIELDRHLRALASVLVVTAPKLAIDLFRQFGLAPERPPAKSSETKKRGAKSTQESTQPAKAPAPKLAPPLFFLERTATKIKWVQVSPKTLTEQLQVHAPWYALPTNANRSYLRARLGAPTKSESDAAPVPPDMIDYFLAHWMRGREPLGRFSSLPLQTYIDRLTPRLQQILREDGWFAIEART